MAFPNSYSHNTRSPALGPQANSCSRRLSTFPHCTWDATVKRLAWIETLPVSGIPFAPDPLDDFAWSMSCDNIFSQSEGLFVNKQIYIPNHDNMYRENQGNISGCVFVLKKQHMFTIFGIKSHPIWGLTHPSIYLSIYLPIHLSNVIQSNPIQSNPNPSIYLCHYKHPNHPIRFE